LGYSISLILLRVEKAKGTMTPWKSRIYDTMALPSPWHYYPLPHICVPFFAIGKSAFATLWHSSESTPF
ncbi:hypothetical protein BHE74_00035967, partial [Ensete ventricosum]